MTGKIRVGLVGARPDGASWGSRGHIPALKSLPDFELKAICTAHESTARLAADAFGADLAFHDYNAMVASPDIDLVTVAVRVPAHYEITMAAMSAGKNVYCEWPLGANLDEATAMADLARGTGVRTMVGLQARSDPTLTYLRQLVAEGYLGDVVTAHMTLITPGALDRTTARMWMGDRRNGANTLTISGGHNIDALCFCLGDFVEVSAKVATQVPQVRLTDTGNIGQVDAPDEVLASGVLEGGALASVHVASVPFHGSDGWRMEVYGSEGTIVVSAAQANYSATPMVLLGAKGREPLAELTVPDEYTLVPEAVPTGAPWNVAQAYVRYAEAVRSGDRVEPGFDRAVTLHRLLAAMEQSSTEGRTISLN